MRTYRTTTSDESIMHVFEAKNDTDALKKAEQYCNDDKVNLWNLDELDEDYGVIKVLF